ncbi:MAG: hypothetical protein HZA22_12350 [Nitrospirae bacterium]|nr:hypothetical protein [Nitrospirota bacterium]
MKKVLVSFAAALFVVAFVATGVSFAAGKKITGKVVSIDSAKGSIVVCPNGAKDNMTLKADADMIKQKMIKAGNVVDITLDDADATMVKKIKKAATVPVGC